MANEKRLIDAYELKADLRESYEELQKIREGLTDDRDILICNGEISSFLEAIFRVNNAPTVDAVEVVHGYWYAHHGITICSHCQAMFDADLVMLQVPSTWEMPNYCPNCGAKMDGDGNV